MNFTSTPYRYTYSDIQTFAAFIESKSHHKPTIGIICGTGLGGLADTLEDRVDLPYASIPNFPVSTGKGQTIWYPGCAWNFFEEKNNFAVTEKRRKRKSPGWGVKNNNFHAPPEHLMVRP